MHPNYFDDNVIIANFTRLSKKQVNNKRKSGLI